MVFGGNGLWGKGILPLRIQILQSYRDATELTSR